MLVAGLGVAVVAANIGLFALRPALLDQVEYELLDWRFRTRGAVEPGAPIAIVGIDAKSVDALGRWPWSRHVMAELIAALDRQGVAAIGLDVTFSEPEVVASLEPLTRAHRALEASDEAHGEVLALLERTLVEADTDAQLEGAIRRSDRTAVGYFFRTDGESTPAEALDAMRDPLSRIKISRLPAESAAPLLTCTGLEANLARFHEASYSAGFFTAPRDPDGVLRRAPLVARCGDDLYPSLSLAVLEAATGSRAMVLGDATGMQAVGLAGERFETDPGGRVLINFRGPAETFPHVSAVDVLQGRLAPDALAGVITIIGPTAVGIGDMVTTPFDRVFPGVEAHANVLDNLLVGDVLRHDDDLVEIELALVLALGIVMAIGVPLLGRAARGALLGAALAVGFAAAAQYVFATQGLWINMAYPLTAIASVYLVTAVANGVAVERAGRVIRRQFATYVPAEVVDEMAQHPEAFQLGGELRDLSMLFSDVRGFTTLAQKLGAEATAHLMNVYLTEMTALVHGTEGTLDKYIGDAVVAFWGAPLEVEGHPVRTAEAAVRMQEATARLRADAALPGAESLRVGIGIHTDQVVVGNLGSEQRFAYTMTGDGVNLCARLESITKYYGVEIIASAELVACLPEHFVVRELDSVVVVGRSTPVVIYEILGDGEIDADRRARAATYAEGLEHFRAGKWDDATRCFDALGDDGPAKLQRDRIARSGGTPPDGWDGVWTFDTK